MLGNKNSDASYESILCTYDTVYGTAMTVDRDETETFRGDFLRERGIYMKLQHFNLGCLATKTVTCPMRTFFALTTLFMAHHAWKHARKEIHIF